MNDGGYIQLCNVKRCKNTGVFWRLSNISSDHSNPSYIIPSINACCLNTELVSLFLPQHEHQHHTTQDCRSEE